MKNTIWNKKNNYVIDYKSLKKELILRAKKSDDLRSRICIHLSKQMKIQEMIICAFDKSFMPPHRHSVNKTESYHIIEGAMDLYIFNNKGKIVNKIKLKKKNLDNSIFYYRSNNAKFWHMPVVKSKYCIWHEVFSGPFIKSKNIIFPKWIDKVHKDHKSY